MSQWTHVCGNIRVDGIQGLTPEPDFKNILMDNVPNGSEGPLEWCVWINQEQSHLAAYSIQIFGDLRDFGEEEIQEITKWIEKAIKKLSPIRQFIIEARVEYGNTHIWFDEYDGVNNKTAIRKITICNKEKK